MICNKNQKGICETKYKWAGQHTEKIDEKKKYLSRLT